MSVSNKVNKVNKVHERELDFIEIIDEMKAQMDEFMSHAEVDMRDQYGKILKPNWFQDAIELNEKIQKAYTRYC